MSASASLPALILASSSPRRSEMLEGLGLDFAVRPVPVDETPRSGENPEAYVLRLAEEKAGACGAEGDLVLAADTVVTLDGTLLGKPADAEEARRMLRQLSGREHRVLTGVAWRAADGRLASGVEVSKVRMADLTAEEIDWYVASGEPLDKAGSYAIQGLGALFVEAVEGNYSNVVGLPLPLTYRLVAELGWNLRDWRKACRTKA